MKMWYEKIKFGESLPWKEKGMRITEGTIEGFNGLVVGVDPGVNFGMTVFNLGYVQILHGKLPRQTERGWHGIDAFELMCRYFEGTETMPKICKAVVEGAAYNRMFKQVELEEVRIGFFLGLHYCNFRTSIVPPASIRLKAFGNGRMQAGDIWPFLNQNAADSVGAALAALEVSNEK